MGDWSQRASRLQDWLLPKMRPLPDSGDCLCRLVRVSAYVAEGPLIRSAHSPPLRGRATYPDCVDGIPMVGKNLL